MSVLVVENWPGTTAGLVGEVLVAEGATLDVVRMHAGGTLPSSPAGHDALLVLGGVQSACDDGAHPYLPRLCELIRGFGETGRPVLGICLGLQLVARAYGGDNLLGRPVEFGYCPVAPLPAAADDPVLSALDAPVALFQWHEDTVTLPPGAAHLATNDHTPVQAFCIGRNVYATQFHFEAGRPTVRRWSADFAAAITAHTPDWGERAAHEIETRGAAADATGAELARRWLALA